jgi:hypothetical protein
LLAAWRLLLLCYRLPVKKGRWRTEKRGVVVERRSSSKQIQEEKRRRGRR